MIIVSNRILTGVYGFVHFPFRLLLFFFCKKLWGGWGGGANGSSRNPVWARNGNSE